MYTTVPDPSFPLISLVSYSLYLNIDESVSSVIDNIDQIQAIKTIFFVDCNDKINMIPNS